MGKTIRRCIWCLGEVKKRAGIYCGKDCSELYRSSMPFPDDMPPEMKVWYMDKERQAWKRGIGWHLSPSEFASFHGLPCYYCGDNLGSRVTLDRIDSNGSYEMGNIVPSCCVCNMTKHTQTRQGFLLRCIRIAERFEPGPDGSVVSKRV